MDARDERSSVADVAAAILNGTPIDWPAIEASASPADRELLEELRLLCTVADLHRDFPAAETAPASGTSDPPQYWGRLRLIERIGGGSFGDVYRAWDPRLRREVALKLIAAGANGDTRAAGFIREGRLLARVRHPGVVTIYDAERIGSRVGLSMEFVDGPTLDQQIRERGPLSVDETVGIGTQLCAALTAAHEAGVLHRDVKAANVVIRPDGRVVLMDFGAGRELDDGETGDRAGTPMYVAPEVLGGQESTVRSDIYSLGVLLHHLLTASYPVPARSLQELRETHARRSQGGGHPLNGLTGPLAAILARATAPAPADRYESATAMANALRAAVTPTASPWRTTLIGAVSVALVAAAGWLYALQSNEPVRIAVMPFELTSDRPDDEGMPGGMAHDLISRLQTYENAHVISAASAVSVGGLALSPTDIADKLDVTRLVVGRISRRGESIAAEVNLIAVPGQRSVWSATYTKPFAQLSDLNRTITQDLARELRLMRAGGAQGWPTWNPTAHALFVKGQSALERMTSEGQVTALQHFQGALKLDPDYAQVHAALADLYLQTNSSFSKDSGPDPLTLATTAASRAMQLDPSLPASHTAAAVIRSAHGDWAGAERAYVRALELGPSDVGVRQHYAHWLSRLGRFEEALEQANEAERLDPYSPRAAMAVASVLRFGRRWEASIAKSHRALELDPGFLVAHLNLGHNYEGLGRMDEAIAAFERWPSSRGNLGNAYAKAGRIDDARRLIAGLEKQYAETGNGAGQIAQIYCGLRDVDRAFEWLAREGPVTPPHNLRVAIVWDPLRKDSRFQDLLKRHHLLD